MPRAPRKYRHFVFGVLQSGVTCAVAAAVASSPFYAEGNFAVHWLRTYLFSWAIMLPVVVVAAPVLRRLAEALTD